MVESDTIALDAEIKILELEAEVQAEQVLPKVSAARQQEKGVIVQPADEDHGTVEEVFETLLYQSRFMVLLAVLGSLFASFMMFVKGCFEIIEAAKCLWPQLNLHSSLDDDKRVLVTTIPAIDYFLFAVVLLMFSMGAYELFISEIDPNCLRKRKDGRPKWLNFHSVDELKAQIGKVVMMILIVNLFQKSFGVEYSKPADLLYLSGTLLLVAISLLTTHNLMNRLGLAKSSPHSHEHPSESHPPAF